MVRTISKEKLRSTEMALLSYYIFLVKMLIVYGLGIFFIVSFASPAKSDAPTVYEFTKSLAYCGAKFHSLSESKSLVGLPLYYRELGCPDYPLFVRMTGKQNCENGYCDTVLYLAKDQKVVFFDKTKGNIVIGLAVVCLGFLCKPDICANTSAGATLFRFSKFNFYIPIEHMDGEVCGKIEEN